MNLPDSAKLYLDGVKALNEWFTNNPEIVSQELAQKRTEVCKKCPMNREGNVLVEHVQKAIKRRMEEKIGRKLHTDGIEQLHTCQACLCHIPAKIWFTLQSVYPAEAQKPNYDPACWILNQS